jgi:HTH-type transcriptional regulator, glycine betaine synthesis regulator
MNDDDTSSLGLDGALMPWEKEMVLLFTSVSSLIGIRKSVGAIYGYLFCQDAPMHLEAIMQRLGMSKGTVSQGLTFLRKVGAVRLAYVQGDRREHFSPEVSLKKLVAGFLRDQVHPHMESGEDRLGILDAVVEENRERVPALIHERITRLRSWQRQAKLLLPMIQKFLDVAGK